MIEIYRGDILLADLEPTVGMEIKKTRPVVVISNDVANMRSQLICIIPITSQKPELIRIFEVQLDACKGLDKNSKAVVNQLRTIDKARLVKKLGSVSKATMKKINATIKMHLDLD